MLMKSMVFILLAGFSFCNPKPPEPPKTCPESCPLGTACTDPNLGCQPIPAPGHVCEVGKEFCNCYVMPPDTGVWVVATCPTDQECTADYQCKTPEPVDPCKGITCAVGYHCEEGTCIKDEVTPPPVSYCPKPLAPGSKVYMRNKGYGQGFDSTVRVYGDPAFCYRIHGVNVIDCHLEGWPNRAKCEMELISGCPIWQFTTDEGKTVARCSDNQSAAISCDHFGDPIFRDDPKTPEFEGKPIECGLQRDEYGPNAGFFMIAHGAGHVRACKPDGTECANWLRFDH